MNQEKLPVGRAMLWVFTSLIVVGALFYATRFCYSALYSSWIQDERYRVVACIGRSRTAEVAQPIYLEELMGLSSDAPISLYAFDTKKAAKKILACPTFRRAKVSRLKPGIVVVDYELRRPVAEIADFENCAIDKSRTLFPLAPFISPKKLPKLYLGAVEEERIEKAFEIMQLIQTKLPTDFRLEMIDVSALFMNAAVPEIVVEISGRRAFLVRFSPKELSENLDHFVTLLPTFETVTHETITHPASREIIDFRIPHLALLKTEERT
jgi:hypothetical protein